MPTLSLNASKKTKQTPAGEIPVDWGCVRIQDIISEIKSGVSVNGKDTPARNGKLGVLRVSCVSSGQFKPEENKEIKDTDISRARQTVQKDSIILSRSNTPPLVGASALIKHSYDRLFLSDKLWQFSSKPEIADNTWLASTLGANFVRTKLTSSCSGSSKSMMNISQKFFLSLPIPLPPLPEQRKIADILATWDRALETLDQLIAAKTRRKQALMQQLLTGKKRLPGFSGEWQSQRFSDFLKESRIPGSNGSTAKKLTVKLYGKGVFAKDEKRIGSANTKYYTRQAGQFIYSKLDFLNGAFGIIPKDLDGYESTLDLPAFDVSENADIRWLLALVSRPHFYSTKVGSAAGGRKARRINPPEFLSMKIDAPGKDEQTAIAQVLDTADHELRLLKQQRTALEQQKRGLMQQLLTGKVRVKG